MKVFKMHGCGNDFSVISYQGNINYEELAIKLCNRKTGIGSDGCIVVRENPLEMLFYNADGTMAPMCGNGIRCFAYYCYLNKLFRGKSLSVITGAGLLDIEIVTKEPFSCKVNMDKPIFNNSMIHVTDSIDSFGRILEVDGINITAYSFFMGTVHTVIFVDSLDNEILNHAEAICKHERFKRHTNVNFCQIVDKSTMNVKTFERGVGWTLACGTGCCSAVVAANKLNLVNKKCKVNLELGYLDIEIDKKGFVYMTGPAVKVFETNIMEENNND